MVSYPLIPTCDGWTERLCCSHAIVSCIRLEWIYCRLSQPLQRPNVLEYFPWFRSLMDCLCLQKTHVWTQPEFCLLRFPFLPRRATSSRTTLFTRKQSPHWKTGFCSKTWCKLKSWLWYELLHFQQITRNCSSLSHFHHCGHISVPAVQFRSTHLLFPHYSAAIR